VLIVDIGPIVATADRSLARRRRPACTRRSSRARWKWQTDRDIGDWQRIQKLATTYADLRFGGTDASVVALAERRGASRIATLNRRHFAGFASRSVIVRWRLAYQARSCRVTW